MNYIITSIRQLVNVTGKTREYAAAFFFLMYCIFPSSEVKAQIPNCDASVPTFNVNFVGNPQGSFTTSGVSRQGNCCGTSSPDRCLHFAFTLDTGDVAVSFAITSGAVPPGALFFQIDCGPMQQYGHPGCISGPGVHHLTFCKPGNNVNTYTLQAIPHPIRPADDTTRIGCPINLTSLGYDTASMTWTSVFPGTVGQYNSYLSCTSGCTNPLFTPGVGAPPIIKYKLCGGPYANNCGLPSSTCDTVTLHVFPQLAVTISPNPASFCPTAPGVTLTATVVGGVGTVNYQWKRNGINIGTNASTFFATSAATYSVTVTDALPGCPNATASVTVTIANVTLTPSHTNVSCFSGTDGTACVAAVGGTPPYTYAWSPAGHGTLACATGSIPAGNYTATVTDAGGCTASTIITVTQPPNLSVTLGTQTNVGCNGQSTGAIDVNVSGGTGAGTYTYHWSNGATTQDLSNIPAGTYTDTVHDANGCIKLLTITITEPPFLGVGPGGLTLTIDQVVSCYGDCDAIASVNVGTGGTPPFEYVWSVNLSDTTTNVSYDSLCAGPLNVLVIDANGCVANIATVISQPDSLISVAIADSVYLGGVNVTCNGTNTAVFHVDVNGGTLNYSYLWNTGDTTSFLDSVGAGHYVVTVTDAHGCISKDSIDITQPDTLLPVITSPLTSGGYNIACRGDSSGSMSVSITGGTPPYHILWSTGDTVASLQFLPAGLYWVTVLDGNGCVSVDSITLTEPLTVAANITLTLVVGGSNILCYGGVMDSAYVIVSGGSPPYTYQWYNGSSLFDSTLVIHNIPATDSLLVVVFDTVGCSNHDFAAIAQPTQLQPSVNISAYNGGYGVSCNGATNGYATVDISGGTPGYTYSWSPPFSGALTDSAYNLPAGTYNITVTDTNGCDTLNSVTLTQPNPLVIANTPFVYPSGNNISCFGATDGSIHTATQGGDTSGIYSYSWNPPISTTDSISGVGIGTYTVTVTDDNGCTATDQSTLNQPTQLVIDSLVSPVFPGGTNISCNGGANGSIYSYPSGGSPVYTHSWSNGDVTDSIFNVSVTTYYDTVTDVNGCIAIDSITLTEPADIVTVIQFYDTVNCHGGATGGVTLSSTGGTPAYQYADSTGFFGPSATFAGYTAGPHIFYTSDINGCLDSIIATIPEPAIALSATSTHTNISCNGGATGTATANPSDGTPPYTYQWDDPSNQTTQTATGLAIGTYTVVVTDHFGCTTTSSQTITQSPPLDANANVNPIQPLCNGDANGSITANPTGGVGPYTYVWSNGQTGNPDTALVAGTYTVIVFDSFGCSDTSTSILLAEPPSLLSTTNTSTDATCNGGANGTATVNPSGGTGVYTYTWSPSNQTTNPATGLTAGVYAATITDANGCRITVNVTVGEAAVIVNFTAGQSQNVCGDSAQLSATLPPTNPPLGPYTGLWTASTGATFADATSPTTTVSNLAIGDNFLTWSVTDNNPTALCPAAPQTINVHSDAVILADAGQDMDTCANLVTNFILRAAQPQPGSGVWTVAAGAGLITDPTVYNTTFFPSTSPSVNELVWTVINGVCADRDTVTLDYRQGGDCYELQLPTAYSPNGDTKNDAYVIHGLELYPNNKFVVFNRWGNEVYSKDNYANHGPENADWHGQNKDGEDLPDGTYFVILVINDSNLGGNNTFNTYVDLRR
jgi:gliding motility-associated-like protein